MIASIFKWVQLALAGVVIVEQTFAADKGKTKQQKALDLINNEAPVLQAALPNVAGLAESIINLSVAAFNIAGLFQHHSAPAAPAPSTPAAAPSGPAVSGAN